MEILDLHRSGLSQREIARKLGISRNTVKKYVESPESCIKDTGACQRQSILDPYESAIKAWLDEDEYYKSTWIYDRLVNQGYTGSYETVKRKVGKLKKTNRKSPICALKQNPVIKPRLILANSRLTFRTAVSRNCTCFR